MSAALRAYAERQAQAEARPDGSNDDANGSSASEADAPLVGKRVLISGLLARPDLNGSVGEAVSFSAGNGRYTVNVNGEQIALRSANLAEKRSNASDATIFQPETRVRIHGLQAKPELNECGATVVEWNGEKDL